MAITLFLLFKVVVMKIILLVVLGIGNLLGKEFHSMLGPGSGITWTFMYLTCFCPFSPDIEKKLAEKQFPNHIDHRLWQEDYLLFLPNGLKN